MRTLGTRFDDQDVQALRHGMAAIDAEHGGRASGFGPGGWRLGPPWRWLILMVTIVLALDVLIRILQAGRS
ncbi:MAG: hypothetical protein CMJ34_07355 [Phycisphaerae bacterium]|nr:hypothetical protein [Phycisphaerae bacterium]